MFKLPRVNKKIDYVNFTGGLDIVSPPLEKKPGALLDSLNYEHGIHAGYSSISGYERFDGQASPSGASYSLLYVDDMDNISNGDTLTGVTSGATGVVVDDTNETYAVLTKLSGTFQAEVINVSGSPVANSTGADHPNGATIMKLHAQYMNAAADEYRDDISAVPGSGDILGVYKFKDVVYAFRNNSDRTGVGMYRSTATGWEPVSLGYELEFTLGEEGEPGTTLDVGDKIYGAISGAEAVLTRIVIESGTFAAGTAAGRFIFTSQVGTFQAESLYDHGSYTIGVASGDSSAFSFPAIDGTFRFMETSFTGNVDDVKLYGVDGKNKGWEFDGETFVTINTGMTVDTPNHVCAFAYHLCYGFIGSFQVSTPGFPYQWDALTGAGEIALGATIVGFQLQPGSDTTSALAIYTKNQTYILYGATVDDFQLVNLHTDTGAKEGTIQQFGKTLVLDDIGITTLATTQAYGNFSNAGISTAVQPIFSTKKGLTIESSVLRCKNQYRLFFSDGTGLYCTMTAGKVKGILPVRFRHKVKCIHSGEVSSGQEETYFGSTDGFVYQLDRGTSFDGDAIDSYLDFAFNHMKSPYTVKKFRRAALEMACSGYAEFYFGYKLGDGSLEISQPTDVSQPSNVTSNVGFSPDLWDDFTWDDFIWDGYAITDEAGWDETAYWEAFSWDGFDLEPGSQDIMGNATSISLRIKSSSDYYDPITFNGCIFEYTPTRLKR